VDHENKIIYSSVHVHDEEQPQISASQKRRLRRKRAKLLSQQAKQQPVETKTSPLVEQEEAEPEVKVIDYAKLPKLVGFPRQGMKIAFTMLEMSKDYQPVISDYKVGEVLLINPASGMITLQLESLQSSQEAEVDPETGEPIRGKFDLPQDDEYETEDSKNADMVTVPFVSLINIKHIV
jgi:hypothetical protein